MKAENASRLFGFAIVAALLPAFGCGRSDKNHVAIHPVQGAIKFRGQPMEGAFRLAPHQERDRRRSDAASYGGQRRHVHRQHL